MDYYTLNLFGLKRSLPLVSVSPKIKIASFNLLGDGELVEKIANRLCPMLKKIRFDHLVGPEVKVVPLLQSLSVKLSKPRYVVLRKNIMGYMTSPISGKSHPSLVLNGPDAQILNGKRAVIIDDVVSSGRTINTLCELIETAEAKVVAITAIFKQGEEELTGRAKTLTYLENLPVFKD